MNADSFTLSLRGQETSLSPEQIDRELSHMWMPATDDVLPADASAVTRVVLGNVIWFGTSDQVEQARAVFQKVVSRFPARFFVLEFDAQNANPEVTASVRAQCFLPEQGETPVCCEMIHFNFGPQSVRHLRGCVAPLLLADLTTILWVAAPFEDLGALRELGEHVDRIIYMASRAENPAARLRECLASSRVAFDLSWFRMKPIRDQVAAFFDDPTTRFRLDQVAQVTIRTSCPGSGNLPVLMGAMFAGWLASKLGWRAGLGTASGYRYESLTGPVKISIEQSTTEKCLPAINTIELKDKQGEIFHLELDPLGDHMEMYSTVSGSTQSERHLSLSENAEANAVGMALTAPLNLQAFRDAARLALPVIEHYTN